MNFPRNSRGGAAESPSCLWADKDQAHERRPRVGARLYGTHGNSPILRPLTEDPSHEREQHEREQHERGQDSGQRRTRTGEDRPGSPLPHDPDAPPVGPTFAGLLVIGGDVEGVNDAGSELIDVRITRYEAEVLYRHWFKRQRGQL